MTRWRRSCELSGGYNLTKMLSHNEKNSDAWQDLRGMLADSDVDAVAALLEERQIDRSHGK
ncbi:MAG: hypothetical protein JWO80_5520 [Bryobacterales bacterium]|nr:hypothetical protein [Bryobacterales bacterium]